MARVLTWTTHSKLGQFAETPPCTTRKADGVPLQIQLGSIYDKLSDKPPVGCGYLYVYLSAFGERPKHAMDENGLHRMPETSFEQNWSCFKSVRIYNINDGVVECPYDPEKGPLTTHEERLAAVKRSYPIVVELLKDYCDAIFDGSNALPPFTCDKGEKLIGHEEK
jgi:hypothetical protein